MNGCLRFDVILNPRQYDKVIDVCGLAIGEEFRRRISCCTIAQSYYVMGVVLARSWRKSETQH